MFSNKEQKISLLFMTTLLVFLAGCTDFISGKKKNQDVIELSVARFVCLQDVPDKMKLYTTGDAQEADLQKMTSCLQGAFSYFQERTKGSVENGYTAEDMRKFFGKYFLKKNNISPELAAQLMKLKQAMIGGTDKVLTKDEITQFISFLDIVRDQAIALRPHIRVLLLEEKDKINVEEIQKATEQLKKSLIVFLSKTLIAKSDYTFTDTKNLFSGLADFISGQEQFTLYANVHSWIPLADAVKVVLMGQKADLVGSKDWENCIQTIVSLYDIILKNHYILKDIKLQSGVELRLISQIFNQSLELILNSFQLRREGQIPFESIDNLIDRIEEKNIFKFAISNATIKDTYRKVLLNILDPVRRGDSRGLHAIESVHLLSLQREFNIWRLNQVFVDSLKYNSKGELSLVEVQQASNEFKAERITQYLTPDTVEKAELSKSWLDLKSLLFTKHPLNFNSQGRVILNYDVSTSKYTWKSLTLFNLMHTLTRGMMLGYGDHNAVSIRQSVIIEDQLSKWYTDFNLLGLEIKAFDPRSNNSGPRSFKEANFFTISGNGDSVMDFNETFELVSFMISGGLSSAETLRQDMLSANCATRDLDVFNLPLLNENCYKQNLRNKFASLFNNMPSLVASVARMSDVDWQSYYNELISAARVSNPNGGVIETADLRTMVMLLHYSESLMIMFDRDRSGGLNLQEVYSAAPRFMSFLRPLSPIKNDLFVRDVFAFLVFKGHQPDASDYAYFQGEKFSQWLGISKMGEAKRINILRVFHNMKEELKKPKKQAVISQ